MNYIFSVLLIGWFAMRFATQAKANCGPIDINFPNGDPGIRLDSACPEVEWGNPVYGKSGEIEGYETKDGCVEYGKK